MAVDNFGDDVRIWQRDWLSVAGAAAVLPAITLFAPGIAVIAGAMIVTGFVLLTILVLVVTFRRNKLGPAAQWTEPLTYSATTFTKTERLMILACLGIIVSGVFVLLASALALRS